MKRNGLRHLAALGSLYVEIHDSWATMGHKFYFRCELCNSKFIEVDEREACCKCPDCGTKGRDFEIDGNCDQCCCEGCSEVKDECTCCPNCDENTANYSYCYDCDSHTCCGCPCECGGCSYCHDCGGHHCVSGLYCENCDQYSCDCCCDICSQCDEKSCTCEHVNEHELAEELGLRPTMKLEKHAAEYYLLLNLWQRFKVPEAFEKLAEMASDLVPEFETYLDMALGGEMRHASSRGDIPAAYTPPINSSSSSRGLAMQEWLEWGSPLQRCLAAHAVFKMPIWGSGSYGGEKWADIAATLKMRRVPNPLDPIKWLDRVWNLQHNGGCALNKIYQCSELTRVLNAHGEDDYDLMLQWVSDEVKELWFAQRDWRRIFDEFAYHVRAGLSINNTEQFDAPLQVVVSEFRPRPRSQPVWSDDANTYVMETNESDILTHWTNTKAFKRWATTTGG